MTRHHKFRILVMLLACLILLPVATAHASETNRFAIERQVYNYLTEQMGLNTAAACGVLANIEKESAFSLTALGDAGTSYGLCQWHDGRYSSLIAYCGSKGLDYRSLQGQLEYLHYELRTGYINLYAQLKNVENTPQGAYQAGYLWCVKFERPADMEEKGVTRGNLAQFKYWNRYSSLAAPDPADVEKFTSELIDPPVPVTTYHVGAWQTTMPSEETVPEREDAEETALSQTRRLQFKAYVPRHNPPQETEEGSDLPGAILAGFLFVTLGDGRDPGRWYLQMPEAEELPTPA